MAAFFVSLLPQFAGGAHASFATMLALGLVFCTLTFGWLALYAVAVTRARRVLCHPLGRRWLDAVAGCAFGYLGLRLASQER
jgi:threonine/homoserine/homoserine lactone efflux protein